MMLNQTLAIQVYARGIACPSSLLQLVMDGYPAWPSGSGRFSTNWWNPPPVGMWHGRSDFHELQYPVLH